MIGKTKLQRHSVKTTDKAKENGATEHELLLVLLEFVAYLGKQFLRGCRLGWGSRLGLLVVVYGQLVDGLDKDEDTESDDKEIDYILDKNAILNLCIFYLKLKIGEIDTTRQHTNKRHEDVID